LKDYLEIEEAKAILVSLHGNNAMVLIKLEDWMKAAVSASAVLKVEKNNVKALFRRGVACHHSGSLEQAKVDLIRVLELDATNAAANKELIELNKTIKVHKQKEKESFKGMFNKTMYQDREVERLAKVKREELDRQQEQDEWTKSKLARREINLDEQSFDDWKKEKEEDKKSATEREEKERKENPVKDNVPRPPPSKPKDMTPEEEEEYDEEDSKILAETKKKGYCYFKNEQSSELKALIGDITPKAYVAPSEISVSTDHSKSLENQNETESEAMKVSSWNHAGTWEEKDMSQFAKDRLTALCNEAKYSRSFDMSDPQSLAFALDAMKSSLGDFSGAPSSSGGGGGALEQLEASMSSVSAKITGVKSLEGDAQIIVARGKKRHVYDFQVTLDFEIILEPTPLGALGGLGGMGDVPSGDEKDAKKSKKFKGTLELPAYQEGISLESSVKFKKDIPPALQKKVNEITDTLKQQVFDKLKAFEMEFKNL
jgi:hypothetical protein